MSELVALFHGSMSAIGIAGFAMLWIVKAGASWLLLRWWRGRRASAE
ncbi:MAG: hypothetical protein JXR13_18100 [Thalassovita sp.]